MATVLPLVFGALVVIVFPIWLGNAPRSPIANSAYCLPAEPPPPLGRPTKSMAHSKSVRSVDISRDGALAASTAADGSVLVWDIKNGGRLLQEIEQKFVGETRSVAFSPDSRFLAMVNAGNVLKIWDLKSKEESRFETGEFRVTSSIVFSPDGRLLATADLVIDAASKPPKKWQVSIWDHAKKQRLYTLANQDHRIHDICFGADGKRLVMGDGRGVVRVWSLESQKVLFQSEQALEPVCSVALSPDGKTLASADDSGTVRAWSTVEWKPIVIKASPLLEGYCVGYLDNGKTLVVGGGKNGVIRTWDVANNKELKPFVGHRRYVSSLASCADGSKLVTGDWDGHVLIWDVKSRNPALPPAGN